MRIELELKLGKGILPFVLGSQIREVLTLIQKSQSCSMKKVMVKYVYAGSKDAYAGGKVRPHDILVDVISCGVLLRFSGVSQVLTSIEVYNLNYVSILYKGILFSLKPSSSSLQHPQKSLSAAQVAPVCLDSDGASLSDAIESSALCAFDGPTGLEGAVPESRPAIAASQDVVEPTFYQIYNVFGMTQKGEYSEDYSTYLLKYGQLDFTFEIPPRFRESLKRKTRLPSELADDPSLVAVKVRHYVSDPSDSHFTKLTWDTLDAYSAFLRERTKAPVPALSQEKQELPAPKEPPEPQQVVQPIPQAPEEKQKQKTKRGGGARGRRRAEEAEESEEKSVEKVIQQPHSPPPQSSESKKEGGAMVVLEDDDKEDDEEFRRFAGGSGLAFSYSPEPLLCGEVQGLKYWDPVVVKVGYGLILPSLMEDALLPFGSNAQDVVMRLGSPESVFYPGRDARLTDVTGDKDLRNVFFYNYFSLGIDVMFDTNSASVVKFVLHCNVPHHKDFNMYAKCNFFVIPERLNGAATAAYKEAKSAQQRSEITLRSLFAAIDDGAAFANKEELINADTNWEEYEKKLGKCDNPYINEVSKKKNPFSETLFYVLDGLVVESLPNGIVASLCTYPLP